MVLALLILACFHIPLVSAELAECTNQPHFHDGVHFLQLLAPVLNRSHSVDSARSQVHPAAKFERASPDSWCLKFHQKGQEFCLPRQHSYNIGAFVLYTLIALFYQIFIWIYSSEERVDEFRDSSWDMAKLVFMFWVLWTHTSQRFVTSECSSWVLIQFFIRSEMTGFSFVSGIFSASCVVYEKVEGKLVVHSSRCARCFREYVLVCVTMTPLIWLGRFLTHVVNGIEPEWRSLIAKLTSAPLLYFPSQYYLWYLVCLFSWTMLAPLMCMLRWPFIISLFFAVAFRSSDTNYMQPGKTAMLHDDDFFYFMPYFVLGFKLAGGGQAAHARDGCRRDLKKFLTDTRVRVAAALVFVTGCVCCATSLISKTTLQSSFLGGSGRSVVPWTSGGLFADVVAHMINLLLNLIVIVVCFMLPTSSFFSVVGSRTLYIYVLHAVGFPAMIEPMKLLLEGRSCNVRLVACAFYVMTLALVLASDITKRLTHHFVQPQWLASLLLIPYTDSSK